MPDRIPVEAYVHGHWCALTEEGLDTIEHALVVYTRIDHPELGDVWIVPREFPMRGPSRPELMRSSPIEIALPASFEVPR